MLDKSVARPIASRKFVDGDALDVPVFSNRHQNLHLSAPDYDDSRKKHSCRAPKPDPRSFTDGGADPAGEVKLPLKQPN
jgi:hypothetical protein